MNVQLPSPTRNPAFPERFATVSLWATTPFSLLQWQTAGFAHQALLARPSRPSASLEFKSLTLHNCNLGLRVVSVKSVQEIWAYCVRKQLLDRSEFHSGITKPALVPIDGQSSFTQLSDFSLSIHPLETAQPPNPTIIIG